MGLDSAGAGEGEELMRVELAGLGESDHVVAEDQEVGEQLSFPVGESWEVLGLREICGLRDH